MENKWVLAFRTRDIESGMVDAEIYVDSINSNSCTWYLPSALKFENREEAKKFKELNPDKYWVFTPKEVAIPKNIDKKVG